MQNEATELEIIMREALFIEGIFFNEQVYARTETGYYIFDFVVFGNCSKFIVECDGPLHYNSWKWFLDARRDLWCIQNDFQDVLRFSGGDIRKRIDYCIAKIRWHIEKYDSIYANNQEQQEKIKIERLEIQGRKNSLFYTGEKEINPWFVKNVTITNKEDLTNVGPRVIMISNSTWCIYCNGYQEHYIHDDCGQHSICNGCRLKGQKYCQNCNRWDHGRIEDDIRNGLMVPVENGVVIHKDEVSWWKLIKSLPINQKNSLWGLIKNTFDNGVTTAYEINDSIRMMQEQGIIQVENENSQITLKILPHAPTLLISLKHLISQRLLEKIFPGFDVIDQYMFVIEILKRSQLIEINPGFNVRIQECEEDFLTFQRTEQIPDRLHTSIRMMIHAMGFSNISEISASIAKE